MMNENETLVLDKLSEIIKDIKEIADIEPALGEILMFGAKMSMDFYESLAKEETYLAKDAIEFIARMQDMPVTDLLDKTYPFNGNNTDIVTADEDLTKFIMNSASNYEESTDNYRKEINQLVADFKAAAHQARS